MTTAEELYGDLPMFPYLGYAPITVERVERVVERLVDRADERFLAGHATQAQYDAWNTALNHWADEQFGKAKP